eukprot:766879-Hanusia_phi.AAC.3
MHGLTSPLTHGARAGRQLGKGIGGAGSELGRGMGRSWERAGEQLGVHVAISTQGVRATGGGDEQTLDVGSACQLSAQLRRRGGLTLALGDVLQHCPLLAVHR